MKTLNDAVRGPFDEGLYTHAYAAYGRLAGPAPTHELLVAPDGRDVFDLASMTKALVATPLIFAEIEAGRLTLDQTLGEWLESAGVRGGQLDPRLLGLTVRSLLRHESGLPAWRNFWINHLGVVPDADLGRPELKNARMLTVFNRAAAELKPNPTSVYSDVGFLLLGYVMELIGKADLAVQFEAFLASLGLASQELPLGYGPRLAPGLHAARTVPTAHCALRRRLLQGEVHDENCASLGGVTAHAGLFGSGRGVARYLAALASSRVGRRLLADNAAARREPPNDPLLGWRQGADPSSETFGDGMAMGHMGFVGTAFWVCPGRADYAIFLTNRVTSGRMRPGIAAARREVFRALAGFRT